MSYEQKNYDAIFSEMKSIFGDVWYNKLSPVQFVMWKRYIKMRLFDQGFLTSEVLGSLVEAGGKRKWPVGVSFMRRIEDVCRKNRIENKNVIQRGGMNALSNLLEVKKF